MALTTYKIFRRLSNAEILHDQVNDGSASTLDVFLEIGAVNAHSTEHAFRQVGEKFGGGAFAAVSSRSWKEEEFEVETITRVKKKGA